MRRRLFILALTFISFATFARERSTRVEEPQSYDIRLNGTTTYVGGTSYNGDGSYQAFLPQTQTTVGATVLDPGPIRVTTPRTSYSSIYDGAVIGSSNFGGITYGGASGRGKSLTGTYQINAEGQFVYCPYPASPAESDAIRGITTGVGRSCFNEDTVGRRTPSFSPNGVTNFMDTTSITAAGYVAGSVTLSYGNSDPMSLLSGRDTRRDFRICDCLQTNPGPIDRLSFYTVSPINLQQAQMNENIERINQLLIAERNSMAFQASTLTGDLTGGQAFTDGYDHEYNPPMSGRIAPLQRSIELVYNSSAVSGGATDGKPMKQLNQNPKTIPSLFSTNPDKNQENACVAPRLYRAIKQLPEDEASFQDLKELPERFNPDDWDFQALRLRLVDLSRDVRKLSEAMRNPEVARIYRRMQFLHRNGMVRNLFSASDSLPHSRQLKQDLYNRIRATFRSPDTQQDASTRFANYRNALTRFFGGNTKAGTNGTPEENIREIQNLTNSGAEINMAALVENINDRAVSITSSATPEEIWTRALLNRNLSNGEGDALSLINGTGGVPPERDASVYARYCPELRFASSVNRWSVLRELEEALENNFTPDINNDPGFNRLTQNVCISPRSNEQGQSMTFDSYLRVACQGERAPSCARDSRDPVEARQQKLARFLHEFPKTQSGEDDSLVTEALIPLLNGEQAVVNVRPGAGTLADGRNPNQGGGNSRGNPNSAIASVAANTRDVTGIPDSSGVRDYIAANSAARTRTPASTTETNSLAPQNQPQVRDSSSALPAGTVFQPQDQLAAAAVTPERKAEVQRRVEESNGEIENISSQIAGIRDTVRAQREAGTDPNSQQLRDLNERLAGLENSLTQERARNADLQRQLTQMDQERNSRPVPVAANTPRDDFSSTNSFRPQSNAPQAQAQNRDAANTPVPSATLPQGGTGGLGGGVRNAPLSRGGSSGVNGALLSVQRPDDTSGGSGVAAITVSNTTPSDYLRLLSQTAGNEITEAVPADLYQQIASGDTSALERYRERIEALPGQVVRLEVRAQGSSDQVELILVKNGGLLTVATRNGRAIASESSPQPEAQVQRSATLQDLNNTVRAPSN